MAVSEPKFIVLLTVANGGVRRSEYVVPYLQPPCEQQINRQNLTAAPKQMSLTFHPKEYTRLRHLFWLLVTTKALLNFEIRWSSYCHSKCTYHDYCNKHQTLELLVLSILKINVMKSEAKWILSARCSQPICSREYHHTADNFHQRNLMEQFYRGAKARSCFHIGWPSASPRSVFFHLPQTFCIATSIIPPQQPTECFFHLPLPFALLPPAFRRAQQPTKYTND